jgi:hypothetical protein
MHHKLNTITPWAWASVSAAVAAVALAGTVAEMTRRNAGQIAVLDPRAPFDPYYGLAEYALSIEPV